MARQAWSWLSEPLAHDFANTIHWRGTTPVDHIATIDGLRSWLRHEPRPLPAAPRVDDEVVGEVRELRDAVRAAMIATAAGGRPEFTDLTTINTAAREHAVTHLIDPDTLQPQLEPVLDSTSALIGVLADAAVTALTDPETRSRIAFCRAPGCGGLFDRDRPNQVWCDPHCGARARAERQQRAR